MVPTVSTFTFNQWGICLKAAISKLLAVSYSLYTQHFSLLAICSVNNE